MKILEEDPPLSDECKLPWLIDALLYPISAAGMIHIAVFIFLPRLVSLLVGLLSSFLAPILRQGTAYIIFLLTAPFYIVFGCYVFYYIAYCVFNSSKGTRRASDAPILDTFSAADLASQVILLVGCMAICLWPAAVYYVLTKRTDLPFLLLSALGVFFLPMSFLRGVMFDSFDALNPARIIQSICSTFVSYCGLVLFFLVLGGAIVFVLWPLSLWRFVSEIITFYVIFVLAHRLGWFYWWHKDRLDWGL
ncbi:MAG: hypothetical protein JSU70_18575 [Phycisphaerales bacterium]|nr:MAG: hypothetical protein JSU70_18575 [Phycisphaerales bacterium]